jgi:hypothetical protein
MYSISRYLVGVFASFLALHLVKQAEHNRTKPAMSRIRIESRVPVLFYCDFRQFKRWFHQSNAFHLRKRHGGGRRNRDN